MSSAKDSSKVDESGPNVADSDGQIEKSSETTTTATATTTTATTTTALTAREKCIATIASDPDACAKEEGMSWRSGKAPDYTKVRQKCKDERTTSHAAASLETVVENLVKNWEVESTKKTDLKQWRTIDLPNYKMSSNGCPYKTAQDVLEIGNYNALIGECTLYSSKKHSWEESHNVFKNSMPDGFAWEVIEVYSGPPVVSFKWRHWGHFSGDFKTKGCDGKEYSAKGKGDLIEMFGVAVAKVTADLRITNLEVYYDPDRFLRAFVDLSNEVKADAEKDEVKADAEKDEVKAESDDK